MRCAVRGASTAELSASSAMARVTRALKPIETSDGEKEFMEGPVLFLRARRAAARSAPPARAGEHHQRIGSRTEVPTAGIRQGPTQAITVGNEPRGILRRRVPGSRGGLRMLWRRSFALV